MTRRIPTVAKGEPIRARWLSSVAENLNTLQDTVGGPRDLTGGQFEEQPDPQTGDEEEEVQTDGRAVYRETSRRTSTVRITSESDDTVFVDVERIDSVSFSGPDGGLTLVFDND